MTNEQTRSHAAGAAACSITRARAFSLAAEAVGQHIQRSAGGVALRLADSAPAGFLRLLRQALEQSAPSSTGATDPADPAYDPLEDLIRDALIAGLEFYETLPAYLRRDATTVRVRPPAGDHQEREGERRAP